VEGEGGSEWGGEIIGKEAEKEGAIVLDSLNIPRSVRAEEGTKKKEEDCWVVRKREKNSRGQVRKRGGAGTGSNRETQR